MLECFAFAHPTQRVRIPSGRNDMVGLGVSSSAPCQLVNSAHP